MASYSVNKTTAKGWLASLSAFPLAVALFMKLPVFSRDRLFREVELEDLIPGILLATQVHTTIFAS